jgi:hypothetical protein
MYSSAPALVCASNDWPTRMVALDSASPSDSVGLSKRSYLALDCSMGSPSDQLST